MKKTQDPTEDQIRAHCDRIQSGWSRRQWIARAPWWAESQAVIDVLVVIDVPESPALGALDVYGLVLSPVTIVQRDTQGQACQGFLKVSVGFFQAPHSASILFDTGIGSHEAGSEVQINE